jgi:Zn-dependent peptidase ImmA (M78 family)
MAPIKYFGAIAVRDDGGDIRASILIRDNLEPNQQRFVLAHMLGHFLMEIQPRLASSEWKSSGFKELVDPMRRYAAAEGLSGLSAKDFAVEDLADRFAGALIMPSAMIKRAVEKLNDLTKVAAFFGVESDAVERRLEDIGVIDVAATAATKVRSGAKVATPIDVLNELAHIEAPRDVPPEQLIRDVSQPVTSMPRAVAAHSYSDAAQPDAAQSDGAVASKGRKKSNDGPLKGMDRIRELARRMDKFGDKAE